MRLFDKPQVGLHPAARRRHLPARRRSRRAVKAQLGEQYSTEDWTVMNKPLFSALTLEKIAVSLADRPHRAWSPR